MVGNVFSCVVGWGVCCGVLSGQICVYWSFFFLLIFVVMSFFFTEYPCIYLISFFICAKQAFFSTKYLYIIYFIFVCILCIMIDWMKNKRSSSSSSTSSILEFISRVEGISYIGICPANLMTGNSYICCRTSTLRIHMRQTSSFLTHSKKQYKIILNPTFKQTLWHTLWQ
jgi:hypothetical protein